MRCDDASIHTTTPGVIVIYNGVQKTTNTHRKLNLFMCAHEASNCIEIFANDETPGEDNERIYVNADMVISKLENGVLLEEFDRRMKELLRLNQIHDRSALLKDVTSRLVVSFLLDRIKIRDESPSPVHHDSITSLPTKRCSIFIEPKPNDVKTPKGTVDFQYESKPVKVTPAKIASASTETLTSELDDEVDANPAEEPLEAIQEEEREEEDDHLCEIKNMNQLIRRSCSRSQSNDSHDVMVGGVVLPTLDEWAVGEEPLLFEDHPLDLDMLLMQQEHGSDSTLQQQLKGVRLEYDSESDEEEERRERVDNGEQPLVHKSEQPSLSSPTERKGLTRKRSMSESDLCVKAAGLASLSSGVGASSTSDAAATTATGIAASHDDIALLRRGSTCKSGKKQLIPLGPSDFHYNKDVPVDVKLPSYLAHTSSNYAKKLPPIRTASPATLLGSGGGAAVRPHTADGNSSRSSSNSRPSTSHGGAVGRLHDLKNSHDLGGNNNNLKNSSNSHSSVKKSPSSVTGVPGEMERGSCRVVSAK